MHNVKIWKKGAYMEQLLHKKIGEKWQKKGYDFS